MMDTKTQATQIVCIDRAVDEDLLFKQSLIQGLERQTVRPPLILVVGSGEAVEQIFSQSGYAPQRREGALVLETLPERDHFERAMREVGRRFVTQLTDAGISSVGFFGADRKILSIDEQGGVVVSGLQTMRALGRSAVVSVLLTAALNPVGEVIDLHPIRVCEAINATLYKNNVNGIGHIVLVSGKLPAELVAVSDRHGSVSWREIVGGGLHFDREIVAFAEKSNVPFIITRASHVGAVSQAGVGVWVEK